MLGILTGMVAAPRTKALVGFMLAVSIALAFVPLVSYAQSPDDLGAIIRAQLLSDPRTSVLSEAQLSAMVDLLTQKAEEQGLTVADITWQPQTFADTAAPTAQEAYALCDGDFTCIMAEAFGFIGPDTVIPFTLGAAAMGLVWILAEMIHRRKYPHVPATPVRPMMGT